MSGDTRGAGHLLIYFVLLLGLAGAGGLIWWMTKISKERRWSNERMAQDTLRAISTAEWDLSKNDRDGNGVKDCWTADVAGLYKYGLIPRELAEADAAPLVPLVPQPIPYRGYYVKALLQDDSETPPLVYRQDTDKTSGKVHHLDHFGFVAYPAEIGKMGNYIWIINENREAFRSPATTPLPTTWPKDNERKALWSRVD